MGVQPPTASLGNILKGAESITILTNKFWLWIPAGVIIILLVISINFIGDALRDAIDPTAQ
jgi:peptide/nickel transport system permease protein